MKSVPSLLLFVATTTILCHPLSAQVNQREEILTPGPAATQTIEPLTVSPLELSAPNEIHSAERAEVPGEVVSEYEVVPEYRVIPQQSQAGRYPPREVIQYGEPGWLGVVFAQGELKEQIESLPMELRPYRPFHFYGNTVRRLHYRGTALPSLGDFQNSTRALFGFPTK